MKSKEEIEASVIEELSDKLDFNNPYHKSVIKLIVVMCQLYYNEGVNDAIDEIIERLKGETNAK